MTIRHLRTFCAVCEEGGITRAAEKLCVAQPSVSQTIAELERYYGVKLFERVGRRLVLTPEGERLRVRAQEAVASFSEFEEAAADTRARHFVRMGASVTIGQMVLPRLVRELEKRVENVEFSGFVDSAASVEKLVEDGSLDFAAVEGNVSRVLHAEEFARDRLAAVYAPSQSYGPLTPKDLSRLPLLLRLKGSASRDLLDGRLSDMGLAVQPWLQSSSNSALLAAARAGLGIAVLPEALTHADLERGTLKEAEIVGLDLSRRWFLVRRSDKKLSFAQETACSFLKEFFAPAATSEAEKTE